MTWAQLIQLLDVSSRLTVPSLHLPFPPCLFSPLLSPPSLHGAPALLRPVLVFFILSMNHFNSQRWPEMNPSIKGSCFHSDEHSESSCKRGPTASKSISVVGTQHLVFALPCLMELYPHSPKWDQLCSLTQTLTQTTWPQISHSCFAARTGYICYKLPPEDQFVLSSICTSYIQSVTWSSSSADTFTYPMMLHWYVSTPDVFRSASMKWWEHSQPSARKYWILQSLFLYYQVHLNCIWQLLHIGWLMHSHALFSVGVTFITLLTKLSLFTKPVDIFWDTGQLWKRSISEEFK